MREELLELLADICEDDVVKEDTQTELFDSGLLDSLGFAELLAGLEEQFGVIISPSQVSRDEMNTPEKIIQTAEARR